MPADRAEIEPFGGVPEVQGAQSLSNNPAPSPPQRAPSLVLEAGARLAMPDMPTLHGEGATRLTVRFGCLCLCLEFSASIQLSKAHSGHSRERLKQHVHACHVFWVSLSVCVEDVCQPLSCIELQSWFTMCAGNAQEGLQRTLGVCMGLSQLPGNASAAQLVCSLLAVPPGAGP